MNLFERVSRRLGKSAPSPLYDLHPELQYRVPIARWTADALEGAASSPSYQTNINFYKSQVWVHKAIKVIKDNLAPLPLRVIAQQGEVDTPVDQHLFTDLLANPNPTMSGPDLWGEWVTDMLLAGEHGLELVGSPGGDPVEVWPRSPNVIWIQVDSVRYRRVKRYKLDDQTEDPYFLDPEEMIFFKFYNPLQPFRGLSPINAARTGIVIDQLAQAWSRLFFKNNARPDFAVIAPEGVTETEKTEMYIALDERTRGGNAHRPVILEDGITDIKTFSFPPKDLEWLEQRKVSRDEIGAIFGVPDEIMGYGRDTYENFATAEKVLWTLTIVSLAQFRDGVLTRHGRNNGLLSPQERVATDFSEVSQLQEDKTAQIEQYATLVQNYWPPNRAIEYLNIQTEDLPHGEQVYVPFGVGGVSAAIGPNESMQLGIKDKAMTPAYGSQAHDTLWKQSQARLSSPVTAMMRKLKKFFQEQQNEVSRNLRNSRTFGRGKFKDTTKQDVPAPGELLDVQKWIERFKELFTEDITNVIALVGKLEIEGLPVSVLFEINNELVQVGITEIIQSVAGKVNETTFDGLLQLLGEAEVAGEGIPAIQERLAAYYGSRKSDWQTERIARTTMNGAANFASEQAWIQSEVVEGKEWLSALIPDRTRDDHAAAHGQVTDVHGVFIVGGEQLARPGDPAGSPGNIINCLCSMIPVILEDA